MMQPFDQQSQELFHGQTQTPDLVGSPASAAIRDAARALAVVLDGPVGLWNKCWSLNSATGSFSILTGLKRPNKQAEQLRPPGKSIYRDFFN